VVLTEKPDVRNMTVAEMVGMGRQPYTGFWGTLTGEDRQVVQDSMQQVGIEWLANRRIDTLSDGERQKVMTAKALAQQTPVIFLDEPTAFLDFPSKVEMMQLLRRLAQQMQKTVFMSTHDLELALQLADTVWLMEKDALSVGTPRQLADSGVLARFVERDGIRFDAASLSVRVTER
jgi:iron complex transport system ATP-binding protein